MTTPKKKPADPIGKIIREEHEITRQVILNELQTIKAASNIVWVKAEYIHKLRLYFPQNWFTMIGLSKSYASKKLNEGLIHLDNEAFARNAVQSLEACKTQEERQSLREEYLRYQYKNLPMMECTIIFPGAPMAIKAIRQVASLFGGKFILKENGHD
jgi:hypothetical protein